MIIFSLAKFLVICWNILRFLLVILVNLLRSIFVKCLVSGVSLNNVL